MKKEDIQKPNYLIVGIMAIGFIGIMAGVISILKTSK